MYRWHCLYHCTAGSSTSLMEIRSYDPRSKEPLPCNLSYLVALKFGLETAILYYEFMMCSSLHLNPNETIPQSCVCLHSADICSLNGFSLAGCLLSNGVTYIRGSINRIAWMVLWISVFKGSMIIFFVMSRVKSDLGVDVCREACYMLSVIC